MIHMRAICVYLHGLLYIWLDYAALQEVEINGRSHAMTSHYVRSMGSHNGTID